jgi:hypothetical protein
MIDQSNRAGMIFLIVGPSREFINIFRSIRESPFYQKKRQNFAIYIYIYTRLKIKPNSVRIRF